MTIMSDAYFSKLKALAMGIENFKRCSAEEEETQFKIVGRLLARYEAQIVADLIDQQIKEELEKYGKEAFERANGYVYEVEASGQDAVSKPKEVRKRQSKPRRAK